MVAKTVAILVIKLMAVNVEFPGLNCLSALPLHSLRLLRNTTISEVAGVQRKPLNRTGGEGWFTPAASRCWI